MLAKIQTFIQKHKYKLLASLGIISISYFIYDFLKNNREVNLSAFLKAISLNSVTEITIKDQHIYFRSNQSQEYHTFIGNIPKKIIHEIIQKSNAHYSFQNDLLQKQITNLLIATFCYAVPISLLFSQIQKSEASDSKVKTQIYKNKETFEDYYGGLNIKIKLKEIIDFLRNAPKYEKMGARIRRGILFYGPPGTGKTLLARALANEAGCEFIKVVASEFQEMFVGVGPKRVRQLFKTARACENGCIIFIDEIDGFGSRLNHLRDSHQTTSTINQLLTEMDGFLPNQKIVIVAATNRIDLVDSAILRAGRFDIKIHIGLPNRQDRIGILNRLLSSRVKKYEVGGQFLQEFGDRSEGWCGADIELLINESIYKAIRDKTQTITEKHLRVSFDQLSNKE